MPSTNKVHASPQPRRRSLIKLGAALPALGLGWGLHAGSRAADFPSEPVTLIVPFPAGGATDNQLRALSVPLSRILKQTVIISNKPGVGGTLGPSTMARSARPDGHTISVVVGTLFRYPFIQDVTYDVLKDFTFVANLTAYSYGIVVMKEAPWKSLAELLEDGKRRPNEISFGATGVGGSGQIVMERLQRASGAKFNFIPYKGAAEETTALLGGHIGFVSDAGWGPIIDTNRTRLLAVMGEKRAKRVPEAPTLTELGFPIVARNPVGIVAPAGVAPERVKILQDALFEASKDPDYLRTLEMADQVPELMNSAQYRDYAGKQLIEEKRYMTELGLIKQ